MKIFTAMLMGAMHFMNLGHTEEEKSKSNLQPMEVMQERHSGRSFDGAKSATTDQLISICEAARLAPSCYNDQPWSFIICDKTIDPRAYEKVFNSLVEFNQGWAKNAPVLVVVIANSKFRSNGKPNRWGAYDTGAAAMNMMLQATQIGLMAHQMGGFDENMIIKEFNLPGDVTPMSVMAIGYEKENEEATPRERKALKENFFLGS